MIADVSPSFFEAPARRDVCVKLSEKASAKGETVADTVGKLEASLYGARDASANWQEEVNRSMQAWGLYRWPVQPMYILPQTEKNPMFGARG